MLLVPARQGFDHMNSNWGTAVENLVRLREIRKQLKAMTLSNKNSESGLAKPERTHMLDMIEKAIGRCLKTIQREQGNGSGSQESRRA